MSTMLSPVCDDANQLMVHYKYHGTHTDILPVMGNPVLIFAKRSITTACSLIGMNFTEMEGEHNNPIVYL